MNTDNQFHKNSFSPSLQEQSSPDILRTLKKQEAYKELDLRDEACEEFRKNVRLIMERCFKENDFKTALRAQEMLAKHFGLLPSAARYRKVRFMGKMLSENELRQAVDDLNFYAFEELGEDFSEKNKEENQGYTMDDPDEEESEESPPNIPSADEGSQHDPLCAPPETERCPQQNPLLPNYNTKEESEHLSPHPP